MPFGFYLYIRFLFIQCFDIRPLDFYLYSWFLFTQCFKRPLCFLFVRIVEEQEQEQEDQSKPARGF